jgi:hypothetical protein
MKSPLRKVIRRMMFEELKDMGLRFFVPTNLEDYHEISDPGRPILTEEEINKMLGDAIRSELNESEDDGL